MPDEALLTVSPDMAKTRTDSFNDCIISRSLPISALIRSLASLPPLRNPQAGAAQSCGEHRPPGRNGNVCSEPVKPTPGSHWIDGNGADSGLSGANPRRRGIRPNQKFKRTHYRYSVGLVT
jgi:hypothetical protein